MLAVLDTNVLVSALLFRGAASGIHRLILEGRIHPLMSPPILAEYAKVLAYNKFGLSITDLDYLIEQEIAPWFELRMVQETNEHWIPDDPSDDKFIHLALSEPSAVLVSGDHHIIHRRSNLPCPIMTVQECIDCLEDLTPY
jgi:putative PIN family toxin of toxin-antitoxin system